MSAAGFCLIVVVLAGCSSGAGVARRQRSEATSAVTELTKPAKSQKSRNRTTAITSEDTQAAAVPAESKPADKPRRLIPEWFRLGQESVPLPTTPDSSSVAADSATGPVEQFQ